MASPWLAAGASTGNALQDIITQSLLQQRQAFQQQHETDALGETVRSHKAEEDYRTKALADNAAERASRDAEQVRMHGDQNAARTATEARQISEETPGGTVIPATDRAATTMQAGGAGPLLRAVGPRPAIDTGPLQPEDAGGAVDQPSFIKLSSAGQQKAAADQALQGRRADIESGRADETVKHDRAMEGKPPGMVVVQTGDGPQLLNRGTGTARPITGQNGEAVTPPTSAQERNRTGLAAKILPHFDEVEKEINDADAAGALGPVKGRTVNEFLAGKVGSTGNAATDDLLGSLNMDMSMLSSGVAALHGRGGANASIGQELLKKMNDSHMSKEELLGAVHSLKKWAAGYAGDAKPGAAAPAAGPKVIRYGLDGKVIPE